MAFVDAVMKLARAQVSFIGPSGDPTDRFVNTFYFAPTPGGSVSLGDASLLIAGMLETFYSVSNQSGVTLAGYMPAELNGAELRTYDMNDPEPRVPLITSLFTATEWANVASSTADKLPREVCMCASYHVGGPGPRNRGRVYIGPLVSTVVDQTAAGGTRVKATAQSVLTIAMSELKAAGDSNGLVWSLWSPTNTEYFPILGGWADDAFDTQRRRGKEPTTREEWGAAIQSGVGGTPGGGPVGGV